mmetsp:Transcript_22862/g.35571  ORF Transcript_22862/g.35571 Transcript_22862/m.35571 type:complete len:186 (-) Transcript_22862:116-673(-)
MGRGGQESGEETKFLSINDDDDDDYYDNKSPPLVVTIFCQGGRSFASLLVLSGCAFAIMYGIFGWAWNIDNTKHLSFYTSDLGIASGICSVVCSVLFIFFNFLENYIAASLVAASGCNIAALCFCIVDILYAHSDGGAIDVVPIAWWLCLVIACINMGLLLSLAVLVFKTQRREGGGIMYVSISS